MQPTLNSSACVNQSKHIGQESNHCLSSCRGLHYLVLFGGHMPTLSCHITNSLHFQKQFVTPIEFAHLNLMLNFLIVKQRNSDNILKYDEGLSLENNVLFPTFDGPFLYS